MPYITQEERDRLDLYIDKIIDLNDGQLNYTITRICHRFIICHKLRYFTLVRVFGGLICVMFELYHLIAAPYEDKKKKENGFISELDRTTGDEIQAVWKCKVCGTIFKEDEICNLDGCCANRVNWRQIRAKMA